MCRKETVIHIHEGSAGVVVKLSGIVMNGVPWGPENIDNKKAIGPEPGCPGDNRPHKRTKSI
jgi:hypothetical protein